MRQAALLLSSLIATATIAQDYLTGDPIWRQRSVCAAPAPCIAYDDFMHTTAGDSLINGTLWTKVVRQGAVSLQWQGPPPAGPSCSGSQTYGPSYYPPLLIRQEGRQFRIWTGSADELLHEFDLQVGQTLPLSHTNWNPDITVDAVDSVLIGTTMRARYALGNSWAQYLIEGVGSSNGLFEPLSNFLECGYELVCFGLGGTPYYPADACDLALSVPPQGASQDDGYSWFEPSTSTFVVRSVERGTITLVDGQGRVARRWTVSGLGESRFDAADLPPGAYVISGLGLRPQRMVVAR